MSECLKQGKNFIFECFSFYENLKIHAEHEQRFIASVAGCKP